MIPPRWRKVMRDLWSNKTRTLLVLLSISIGVTTLGMVITSQLIVERDLPEVYASINPASATLYTLTTFDADMVETIRALPEVEAAEGRRFVNVRFLTPNGEWRNLQLNVLEDYESMTVNRLRPSTGAYPPPRRSVLIERASFSPVVGLGDFAVGDTLVVEPPDGKQRELPIAGSVHDMSQLPAFLSGSGYGYITQDTLEWLGESRDFNQLVFVTAENKFDIDHVNAVAAVVQEQLEKSGQSVLFTLVLPPGEHPAQTFLNTIGLLLAAMGILSLILSGFLIINTLSAILAQQVRQIGIMKSIGARTRQITWMYVVMVSLFSILSLVIAVPLGALGGWGLARLFAGFLNFDISGLAINPQVVLIQAAIALLIPLLAAVYPIVRGVRVTVREAISDQGITAGAFGSGMLDRAILSLHGVVPFERPVQISLRNTFRRKGRLVLTLITLSLASAIFISIFSVRASLQQTLDDALNFFDYDVLVQFSRPYRADQLTRVAGALPDVVDVESWGFSTGRRQRPDGTESDNIIVYAPHANSPLINPTIVDGRWLEPDDTNTIVFNTDATRNEKDIAVGQTVTMSINGRDSEWVVVGLVRGILTGPNAFINYPAFGKATRSSGQAQIALASTAEGKSTGEVGQALEELYRRSGFRVEVMQTIDQVRVLITSIFNVIILFLLFMAALLGTVGGLGLMGTMSINVLERTREIGVMRAIGASDAAVLWIVLVEGMIIGLVSWLIGVVVSFPLSKFLADIVGTQLLQSSPSFAFSIGGAAGWLLIVILLSMFASFLPARRASSLTVREVLSYE